MTDPRMRTHHLGSKCAVCKRVLVPDDCSCRNPHGYGYQEPNEWAARTWPNHPCFGQQEEAMKLDGWLPYVSLGSAAVANLLVFITGDHWIRWLCLAVAGIMIWAAWQLRRNRRDLDQMERDFRARLDSWES